MIPHMHQESVEKLIAHKMRLPGESRAEFQEVENSLRKKRGKTSLSHFIWEMDLVNGLTLALFVHTKRSVCGFSYQLAQK